MTDLKEGVVVREKQYPHIYHAIKYIYPDGDIRLQTATIRDGQYVYDRPERSVWTDVTETEFHKLFEPV